MMHHVKTRRKKTPDTASSSGVVVIPTFMDHVRELQSRLFAVVLVFIVLSAAAYPFFDKIVSVLVAPLGKEYQLVYLTPGGAFTFIIQVCMYIGFIAALPAIIYHVYRFIMPVVNKLTLRSALTYTLVSFVLAIVGMVFAYVVSLPAALYFLTNFNLYHINPMLTIDSYLSFVMTYLLVGALLFQIPLLMMIINGVKPLKPKKLMSYQGKIILISFIIAAVVSPTPDALNQALLASPMIIMYQAGILLVWFKNKRLISRRQREQTRMPVPALASTALLRPPGTSTQSQVPVATVVNITVPRAASPRRPIARSLDGFAPRLGDYRRPQSSPQLHRQLNIIDRAARQQATESQRASRPRSIDGFFAT